jgi:hypothetical protein
MFDPAGTRQSTLPLLAEFLELPDESHSDRAQEGLALYATLVKKEAELRKKNRGTFYRTAGKKRNSSKWRHRAYPGWLNLERGLSEVVLAEIHAPAPEQQWQLLSAFLGFIDRHFGKRILAITIHYR